MMGMVIKGKKRLTSREFQRKVMLFFTLLLCMFVLMNILALPAYATGDGGDEGKKGDKTGPIDVDTDPEGTDKLNKVVGWLAGWAGKIGLVVAFFGALQTVLGFMNDDADSKVRGLKTMAAGFMVWGIAISVNLFFT